MTDVRVYDGSGNRTLTESYEFDFMGNRVSKTTNGVTTRFAVDMNNWITHVTAEIAHDGTVIASYIRAVDRLISQTRGTVTHFYILDGHRSVRMLMDASGNVTDTYDFDAFGNL